MTVLQNYADEIWETIKGLKSFDIPSLELDLGVNENNFRNLRDCSLITLVRKQGKTNKYRLETCTKEAFKVAIGVTESQIERPVPKNWVGLPKVEDGVTNLKLKEALERLHKYIPIWHAKFNTENVKFSPEGVEELLAIILTWLEQYKNDPRSNSDDARFALFILEYENEAD